MKQAGRTYHHSNICCSGRHANCQMPSYGDAFSADESAISLLVNAFCPCKSTQALSKLYKV